MKQHPDKRTPRLRTLLLLAGLSAGFQASSAQPIEQARVPGLEHGSRQVISPDHVPEGLGKSDWASIREAYEAGRHAFRRVEGEPGAWQARNPGQGWTTTFDGRGFVARPQAGGWKWGLELKSYGFGDEQRAVVGKAKATADGSRLTYAWDRTVQEWFVNDQRGLEHGFTLSERPKGLSAGYGEAAQLTLTLAVRGGLRPKGTPGARGIEFRDAGGALVLNYAGLKVWDADGTVLPARLTADEAGGGGTVSFSVDDRAARYPITIDPLAQQVYLKAGNTGAGDWFGWSVSVSGDTVVVGAWGEDSSTTGVNSTPDEGAPQSGAAYVFVRSGGTWTQQAYLKAGNTGTYDNFGYSVSVSGDTVVVGAYLEDSSTTGVNSTPDESAAGSGAVYVFVRSGGTWAQQAYLKAGNTGTDDEFGYSVSVSGDTVVVGAGGEDSSTTGVNSTPNEGAPQSGAAYVFVRGGGTWTQQAYLKAGNTEWFDYFAYSVSVSGDTVVVGAFYEDSSTTGVNSTPNEGAPQSGAAYVFVRSGGMWTQQAYLKAGNTGAGDWFGWSVSVSGDTVVVGAWGEDSSTTGVNSTPDERASDSGAVYVFANAPETPPSVTAPTTEGITPSTATVGGTVATFVSPLITERGVVYSMTAVNADPRIGGAGVTRRTVPGTFGVFSTQITGLAAMTAYSFKAYATNALGTSYATTASFTTLSPSTPQRPHRFTRVPETERPGFTSPPPQRMEVPRLQRTPLPVGAGATRASTRRSRFRA